MKCEICNTIERLGLNPSAHDMWFCSACEQTISKRSRRETLETLVVKAAMFPRLACDLLVDRCRQLLDAGVHSLPAYRRHYITLGL